MYLASIFSCCSECYSWWILSRLLLSISRLRVCFLRLQCYDCVQRRMRSSSSSHTPPPLTYGGVWCEHTTHSSSIHSFFCAAAFWPLHQGSPWLVYSTKPFPHTGMLLTYPAAVYGCGVLSAASLPPLHQGNPWLLIYSTKTRLCMYLVNMYAAMLLCTAVQPHCRRCTKATPGCSSIAQHATASHSPP
jgi:hypothetical protein